MLELGLTEFLDISGGFALGKTWSLKVVLVLDTMRYEHVSCNY